MKIIRTSVEEGSVIRYFIVEVEVEKDNTLMTIPLVVMEYYDPNTGYEYETEIAEDGGDLDDLTSKELTRIENVAIEAVRYKD